MIRTVAEAIREATVQLLTESRDYFIIGEGITDEKGAFGTTMNLHKDFPDRVFDMPICENGLTGVCLGASLNGMRPIMVHMRTDFLPYAADQIINNLAKWHGMFGGQAGNAPVIIRAVIGRGWGQGMQHSQHLEQLFAQIEGLRVVCPSNAYDAKGLLLAAACGRDPVLFIEHRWIHELKCEVPKDPYFVPLGEAAVLTDGDNYNISTYGYMVHECLKAAWFLGEQGIHVRVVDERRPIPEADRLPGYWYVTEQSNCPPAPSLSKSWYLNPADICRTISGELGMSFDMKPVTDYVSAKQHDVPNADFRGPF